MLVKLILFLAHHRVSKSSFNVIDEDGQKITSPVREVYAC